MVFIKEEPDEIIVEELPKCIHCGRKLENNKTVYLCNDTKKIMCRKCVSAIEQFSKCTKNPHTHSLVVIKLLSTAVAEKL